MFYSKRFFHYLKFMQRNVFDVLFLLFLLAGGGINAAFAEEEADSLRHQTITSISQAASVDELADILHKYFVAGGTDQSVLALSEISKQRLDEAGIAALPNSARLTMSQSRVDIANNIAIGQTSAPQTVTLTNSGAVDLQFQAGSPSVSTYYGFKIAATTCGTTLPAASSCTASITFTPTQNGWVSDTYSVKIVGYASTVTQTSLRATGGTPLSLSISPPITNGQYYPTVNFGTVAVGQTSSAQTVTLTNTGLVNLEFQTGYPQIFYGPFSIAATTCGSTLLAGASCTLSITFSPANNQLTYSASSTTQSAFLYINFKNYADYKYVYLTGNATGATWVLTPTVSPSSLNFGTVSIGQTSAPQTMTLTNTNQTAIQFASGNPRIGFGSNSPSRFSITANTCGVSLAAGASCTVAIVFTPTLMGSDSDYFGGTIINPSSNIAYNSTYVYSLYGTGAGTPLSLQITPLLNFDTAAPVCTLSASPSSVNVGGSSTLTARCSPAATSYTWTDYPCYGIIAASCTVTAYYTTTYSVVGTNADGSGNPVSATVTVASSTVPGAPTGVVAKAGSAKASVTFNTPSNTGGSAIKGYTVYSSPAGGIDNHAGSSALNHLVTGLINGTRYSFTVTATNTQGTGSASIPSNSVIPMASQKGGLTPILMLLLD
jgi:hypothetical protein